MEDVKILYHNSKMMLERARKVREKIEEVAEQCSQYPRDTLVDWLRDDMLNGVRSKTNQLLYEFAEKNNMSLHDVCMNFMPEYNYKSKFFNKDGHPAQTLNVDICLKPMPLDLEYGPGYWKGKYYRLKARLQQMIDNKED